MNILFIHQNFPGQFKNLSPTLAKQGHTVVAMTMQKINVGEWQGVKLFPYGTARINTPGLHPWLVDFETKVIRAEACFRACLRLKEKGFEPDVIIAHPGWGESLFVKEVWPKARLGIYCEFFYHSEGADVGFDPEFKITDPGEVCRIKLKNLNNILHFEIADAGISPTRWQASTFPEPFRSKITVIHDGIDTEVVIPNPYVKIIINNSLFLTKKDEVITFVSRNLEPYRGYHIFMRALPEILKRRPKAYVLIVGGNGVSYGDPPDPKYYGGLTSWKDIFINEVREKIKDDYWKRIFFLGNIPYEHFIAVIQLSTVHVYLTYPFVLSWSLLEAMSAGCSVVASNTPPVKEVIEHGVTGRLVDFFDIEGLAYEVCDLLEDNEARKHLGVNARDFIKANYDLKTVCLPKQVEWVEDLLP